MMAGAPKASSTCNSHLVFATLQSQIIAARREPLGQARNDEESKKDVQAQSSEIMEVTTPTVKEDRKVSWGPNEVREYHEEEGNKDITTRRQAEDDIIMVVNDGGSIDEGSRGIPLK